MGNCQRTPPKPGVPPLHAAARLGDHREIRRLVAGRADIDAVFDMGLDPLGYSISATPLMVAAGSGDGATIETVRLLLKLGANIKIVLDSRSAADFAARGLGNPYQHGGDARRLMLLLESGSPIVLQGVFGARLVADTAALGDSERVSILLGIGATPNAEWDAKAANEHHHRVMSLARFKMDEMLSAENLPLQILSLMHHKQDELDAPLTAPHAFEIPLFQAVSSDTVECVRLLLQAGANLLQRDNWGQTAVFHARSEEVLRLLLKEGLSLNDRNKNKATPLEAAISDEDGDLACKKVQSLIAAGANVNAAREDGRSPFMLAVSSAGRNFGLLQMLLKAGADPHAVAKDGCNAFHAAIDTAWAELHTEDSVRRTMSLLKQLGVDLEHRDAQGETPLARAIAKQRDTETKVLLELGANPEPFGSGLE
jgi:ankyrin repeat protein